MYPLIYNAFQGTLNNQPHIHLIYIYIKWVFLGAHIPFYRAPTGLNSFFPPSQGYSTTIFPRGPMIPQNPYVVRLVGGFNPLEKYDRQKWESSPFSGVKIKNI